MIIKMIKIIIFITKNIDFKDKHRYNKIIKMIKVIKIIKNKKDKY
jgi:hypothetical protein